MTEIVQIFDQEASVHTEYLNMVFIEELTVEDLQKLRQFTNLTHLNASFYKLEDEHLPYIAAVSTIELLDLVLTEITDKGLAALVPMTNLEELRLKDNPQLTDNCLTHLSRIKSLKLLHLDNTDVTVAGLKTLLADLVLETVILDSDLATHQDELKQLSVQYPNLEIRLKGTGTFFNGELT